MTSQDIAVDLQERSVIGKGLRKLRDEGLVPAVIHDHGKPSMHVTGDYSRLVKTYQQAGKHHPVQLSVGKKHHLALIKDVDFEPTKHRMRHIVFQAIKQDEEVEAEIPVVFMEDVEIPAEKVSLLVLKQLDHVEVKALPGNLPDELVVDPGTLREVGDHLTVADLKIPEGVIVLTDPHSQIAIVEIPADQLAAANEAAADLAADAGQSDTDQGESERGGDADQAAQVLENRSGGKDQKEPEPKSVEPTKQ